MKAMKKIALKLQALKEKYSKARGKGKPKSETQIYNHPRR